MEELLEEGLSVTRPTSGVSKPFTIFGISVATLVMGYLLASNLFMMVIILSNTQGYSNHVLESQLHDVRRELRHVVRNITELQTLLACANCTNGTLYITNIHTNGTIEVYNSSSGLYFDIVVFSTELGETVTEQGDEIAILNQTVSDLVLNQTTPGDAFRIEILDFVPIDGLYPNVTIVPFVYAGIFSYSFDVYGVFDTSNSSYVEVNRDALVSADFGIYYAGNGTDPNLLCMLFPFLNSSIFMDPPLIGAGQQAVNISGISGFPYDHVGTVNGAGQFKALAGMQLNVQCTAAEPQPFLITPSSFMAMQVNALVA